MNDTRYLGPVAGDRVFSSQAARHGAHGPSDVRSYRLRPQGPQRAPRTRPTLLDRKEVGMLKVWVALAVLAIVAGPIARMVSFSIVL